MKYTIIAILVAALLIGGALFFGKKPSTTSVNNVTIVEGNQIIEIGAKGGYSPQQTVAKADVPTILKVTTRGTFDCSAALTIPSLNYSTMLQPSGEVLIEVPPQKAGSTLQGICGMGMYNFQVQFN